jgi:hypothetical protein
VTEPLFPIKKFDQVCVVVRDLRQAMQRYVEILGTGPWRVYTYGPRLVRRGFYRGQPAAYEIYLAFCQTPSIMLELIEPRQGPTIHHEFLEKNGEGIHHFGVFIPKLDDGIAQARAAGFDVLMSGHGTGVTDDGGFAYLDTEATLGTLVELIEAPTVRHAPEEIYPGE